MEEKPVDEQVDTHHAAVLSARDRVVAANRRVLASIFGVVRLLARLCLPFRGDDERSKNKGVFLEVIHHLAENGNQSLKEHLLNAPRNARYISHRIQNEMIRIIGDAIKNEIIGKISEAKIFTIMMDETRDLSHRDQVIVVIRFVNKQTSQIEERLLTLVTADEKTGESLEALLLSVLETHNLSVSNIVGQGYDGGSNFAGIFEGVQARILAKNEVAMFIHCFAHSLNRAVVNSMNHKSIPEARNFFALLELLVVFIKSGNRIKFFLRAQSKLLEERKALEKDENRPSAEKIDCLEAESSTSIADTEASPSPSRDLSSSSVDTESYVEGSSQPEPKTEQNKPLAPGKGICDTRWGARASTLHRYAKPVVLKAAVETVENAIETSNDPSARATAIGLKKSILQPRFLLLLTAFRPVLTAVHIVSQFLQTVQIDVAAAMVKVDCLKSEIRHLRTENAWEEAQKEAYELAKILNVDIDSAFDEEDALKRKRKRPKRIEDRPETEAHLSSLEALRVQHYYPALDKLIAELDKRFPNDLQDFKFLQPEHYFNPGAEDALKRLGKRYRNYLNGEECVTQWRIFRHTPGLNGKTLQEIYSTVPNYYGSLKTL